MVKPATGVLRWLLAGAGQKEAAWKAAESLQLRMGTSFGDPNLLTNYQAAAQADKSECRAHFRENAAAYYAALGQYCKHLNTEELPETGLSKELLEAIEAQQIDLKYLNATLRGYQTFGVKYAIHQKRTLLGDEMGLGKTFQAMATMAALKAAGKHHFMVVCPASVLINWQRELTKHTKLAVTKVHGADETALRYWRENGDVAVTTFESISRFELPEKFKFDMLVVDEAHYVKNPEAQRTVAIRKLLAKTEGVLYMSGTPLVNRVDEMCFLVNCLQPEIAKKLENVKNISTAEQFRKELAPVYLRRVRADVLKELPDLIEKQQWCELSEQEWSVYREAVASGNLMAIRQVSWQMDSLSDSSKAKRLLEICNSAKEEGRKIIVFSFFRNTLEKVRQLLGERCLDIISGDISPARRQEIVDAFNSAKPGAVLVSQVQAGGTGLNIQAASVIVFCEPQLTPAIENQAVSRAYRMGQTRDVLVHRLLADDTIDERMLEILSGKQQEFNSFADDSVVGESQLKSAEGSWVTRMVQQEQQRLASQSE
jgi:SNF2 family DNA or RNA helicase